MPASSRKTSPAARTTRRAASTPVRRSRHLAPGPVIVDVAGLRLTEAERKRLRHPLVGGVILFARNYQSPEQLRALTDEIHAVRSPALLVAVDHEGGRVQRFREGFSAIPAMRTLGERWDADVLAACREATEVGRRMGEELRAAGVDFTFAPVLDLDWGRSSVIGNRAFHHDPRVVAMLARCVAHGLLLAGMGQLPASTSPGTALPMPIRTSPCPRTRAAWTRSLPMTRLPTHGWARRSPPSCLLTSSTRRWTASRPASPENGCRPSCVVAWDSTA